ncbi:hypothetical protein ABZU76_01830 [Amycolatopsis sp. NPDC005232]|uniref:hypothetical protein n=1 Tax=Amycolatopsis sp. NPDC005232 TaxID=3157027 RepID=UPI0033B6C023
MAFFGVSFSFRCFCFARFAYFVNGSGSVFFNRSGRFADFGYFADLGSGSDFAFFTGSGYFACFGLSHTDLRLWLGIGCHDLGSAGYLGVSFVDFARFSLGRFALPSARSSNSLTLGRSFAVRFGFSRATFTRRGLTSLPFVGAHGFSCFASHRSFASHLDMSRVVAT